MMKKYSFSIKSKKEMKNFANIVAENSEANDIILLKGDLGVGKTFFAKNFIASFYDRKIIVNSPTFNLVQTYSTEKFTIYHYDLYRLKKCEEVYSLGIEQAWSEGISLIEWPEIILEILPSNCLDINILYKNNKTEREIIINASASWTQRSLIEKLEKIEND